MAVDRLASRLNVTFSREKYSGLIAQTEKDNERLLLLKPLTYMNNCGHSVAKACRNRVAELSKLLVVLDDVHLPLGTVRLRVAGSAGGHNGLKSVIEHMGTQEFPRLRMGVGIHEEEGALTRHVLGKFNPAEALEAAHMVERAADAVERWLSAGIEQAMNEFN